MGGHIHVIDPEAMKRPLPFKRKEAPVEPTIDAAAILERMLESPNQEAKIAQLSNQIGVSRDALTALGCAFSNEHRAYAFPMFSGSGHIIGIRLRDATGRKWAVTGSKQGIFWPVENEGDTGYICEGPTDTAAILSMGLPALGRPSCNACVAYTLAAIAKERFRRVVIITDNDDPGVNGAKALQQELRIPSCILIPPAKDIRAFYTSGGDRQLLESVVESLVWKQPTTKMKHAYMDQGAIRSV